MFYREIRQSNLPEPLPCNLLEPRTVDPTSLDPNPPMDGGRIAGGGEEVTDATVRTRIRVDWRLAVGLPALLGAPMAACNGFGERDGGIGHGKTHSRTTWRELAGRLSQWRTCAVRTGSIPVGGRIVR